MRSAMLIVAALAAFAGALSATPSGAQTADQKVLAFCKKKWSDDYDMQLYCMRTQLEAAGRLVDTLNAYKANDQLGPAIGACIKKWTIEDLGIPEFDMTMYCIDKQVSAYREIYGEAEAKLPLAEDAAASICENRFGAYGQFTAAVRDTFPPQAKLTFPDYNLVSLFRSGPCTFDVIGFFDYAADGKNVGERRLYKAAFTYDQDARAWVIASIDYED